MTRVSAHELLEALAPVEAYPVSSAQERAAITALGEEAKDFLSAFNWCSGLEDVRVGFAVPGVIGVFLTRIRPARPEVDAILWVVVGDLPPAYLVTDEALTPGAALESYIAEMRRWVEAVLADRTLEGVIPVAAEPTHEHARMLAKRLSFLEREVLPLVR